MFTQDRALTNFASELITYAHAGVILSASAAVVFVAGLHAEEKSADISASLRKVVEEQGLSSSQVSKYVTFGRMLAAKIADDEMIYTAVIGTRSPTAAQKVVVTWLETKGLTSAEAIGREFGVYQRTPRRVVEAATTAPAKSAEPTRADVVLKPQATPETILEQMNALARRITDVETAMAIRNIWDDRVLALQRSSKRRSRSIHDGAPASH